MQPPWADCWRESPSVQVCCENSLTHLLPIRRLLCCLLAALGLLLLTPGLAWAQVHQHENEDGVAMVRSLESLRDLDYDSWQAVAYREGPPGQPVVLRVVGYPGKLRLDHPVSLQVLSLIHISEPTRPY